MHRSHSKTPRLGGILGRPRRRDYTLRHLLKLNGGRRTKMCRGCKVRKSVKSYFVYDNDSLMAVCKRCHCNRSRGYITPKRARDSCIASRRRKQKVLRSMLDKYKDRPCVDCGGRYPSYVMDLDHVRGKKKVDALARMTWSGTTVEKMRAELEKCEPVCANCHRERTFNRNGHKKGAAS